MRWVKNASETPGPKIMRQGSSGNRNQTPRAWRQTHPATPCERPQPNVGVPGVAHVRRDPRLLAKDSFDRGPGDPVSTVENAPVATSRLRGSVFFQGLFRRCESFGVPSSAN